MQQQKLPTTESTVSNFIIAIRSGFSSVEEVKKYLDMYTNDLVNKLEVQSRQPSLYFSVLIADHNKAYEIMKLLLDAGANPNFKDQYIQTVLFYACREGKERCFDLLLGLGVALDEQDIYGQTPLYYIARENRLSLLHKIIDKVNVNHADKITSQTALFYSAREGHLEMCKHLIEAGCDVSHQDSSHKTAAFYAKKNGKNEVVDYLTAELQKLKEQKKFSALAVSQQIESRSKEEDKRMKKKIKLEPAATKIKTPFKLVRMDQKGQTVQLTQAEFTDWVKDFPQLQAMLLNPDSIEPQLIQQVKQTDSWEKAASRVLMNCWKIKGAYIFHDPVDPKKFGISDYFDIVKHPMDFGTVKRKLQHNFYRQVREFCDDMMLVFSNCVLYNGNDSEIGRLSLDVRRQFEESARANGLLQE